MKSSKQRVETLCCQKIGNSELKVFAEDQPSEDERIRKTEFIFEINSSHIKQQEFGIGDLYKIMSVVYHALNDYVEKKILGELNTVSAFQVIIEADGGNATEVSSKDSLYDYHLDRLAKKFTGMFDDIFCEHTKENITHYLTFSRVAPNA